MPPLTLAMLATLLQMHGADTTIVSDNKGVDHLLGDVRQVLEGHANPNAAVQVNYGKIYDKGDYQKATYTRSDFSKSTDYMKVIPIPPKSN